MARRKGVLGVLVAVSFVAVPPPHVAALPVAAVLPASALAPAPTASSRAHLGAAVDRPGEGRDVGDDEEQDRTALLVRALGSQDVERVAAQVKASASRRPVAFDTTGPTATYPPTTLSDVVRDAASPQPSADVAAPDFEYAPTAPVFEEYEQIDASPTLAEMMPTSRRALLDARGRASKWACPLRGYRFGSTWGAPRSDGRQHEGTDIIAPVGAPLRAVNGGVVVRINTVDRPESLGGITVSIAHSGSESVYYAHLARLAPEIVVGARVSRDQIVGVVGQTGNARFSVPHLHFGWYLSGAAFDATDLLQAACGGSVRETLAP